MTQVQARDTNRSRTPGEVGTMSLRGLAALLLLGGIIYAMLSRDWGDRSVRLQPRHRGAEAKPALQDPCGAEPTRACHRVSADVGRRFIHDVHRNQDGDRRNIGGRSLCMGRNELPRMNLVGNSVN
jgi:hypothetical protein